MIPIPVLLLLAISISPALSQPRAAANDDPADVQIPKSTADVIPFACQESNILVTDQLAEITHLQSRSIPVPHDLVGYFYAVVKGRRMLGCPNPDPFSTLNKNSTSAQNLSKRSSSEEAQIVAELCKPARQLKEEVMDQIAVLEEYKMPIPDFLAGWWSVTKDADSFLNCGFHNMQIASDDKSTAGK